MNNTIKEMLINYKVESEKESINAMKEIIQEIILCGLSRNGFFEEAAFYGGTALRIFYGLDRFSEDLDFALIKPNKEFSLEKYFIGINEEISSYGLKLRVETKVKQKESNISSAFLKGDTLENILVFFPNDIKRDKSKNLKDIKIKFEVDINPPAGANYECKYKLLPQPHRVKIYDESSLFAGKIHAILCRNWRFRVKGRDLYDYIFFLKRNVKVNLDLVKSKLIESNVLQNSDSFDIDILKKMLKKKFLEINYTDAIKDVESFVSDTKNLQIWSSEFFQTITEELK